MKKLKPEHLFKGKTIWICQTGPMPLWVGLAAVGEMYKDGYDSRKVEIEAIRSYPYSTEGCKCVRCRYKRMFDKLKK